MIRLDKYLADTGAASRREAKAYIRRGEVTVDGVPARAPEQKIAETAVVCLRGQILRYQAYHYYMLHKPAGVLTATADRSQPTVLDLFPPELQRFGLVPAGRLDKDTEGLLLITNDGELAHRLLSPKKHVDKVYYAKVQGKVDESDVKAFADGVDIGDDTPTKSADLRILKSEEESEIELTITEGRFHQVKRMFHAVGKEVIYLKRLSMGSLVLDKTLTKGEYRSLTEEEIKKLC